MALVLKHATAAQLGAAFRERYRNATGYEAGRLAKWALARISDGTFTDTQVRNFFGLTAGQYTTLKNKWTTLTTSVNAVDVAVGE